MNRAYAKINLNQLIKNLRFYQEKLNPETEVLGVVKADAYGHGAVRVAQALALAGVNYFGVAWLNEARELRQNGITSPILILSQPDAQYIKDIIELDVAQTVYDWDFVAQLNKAAPRKIKVHIKIDTGMNRIGVQPENFAELLRKIKMLKNIEIEGLFTHLACPDDSAKRQLELFDKCVKQAKKIAPEIKYVHAVASAGALIFPEAHYNMVRLGIGLYKDVMTLKSRVMAVKTIPSGSAVSYGATFTAEKPARIATISIGYADGLSRLLSNRGLVLIRGQEFPLRGNICMDMCMAEVSEDVQIGDEVVIIGRQGDKEITAQMLADLTGTIDYEIMCGIGKRVPRNYPE